MAEAKFPDCRHRAFFHAVEEVDQVAVKVVVYLKGINRRLSEKNAATATEHVDEASVVQWEQRIKNVQDRSFVSYTGYRGFDGDHLAFHKVPTAP